MNIFDFLYSKFIICFFLRRLEVLQKMAYSEDSIHVNDSIITIFCSNN